jgi:hypothetical protein
MKRMVLACLLAIFLALSVAATDQGKLGGGAFVRLFSSGNSFVLMAY